MATGSQSDPRPGQGGDAPSTARWCSVAESAPELAAAVHARFAAHRHHLVATLHADGAPRLRGIEVQFVGDDLCVGMMPTSRKAADLVADPRLALHSHPDEHGDALLGEGDASVEGRAERIVGGPALEAYVAAVSPPEPFAAFTIHIERLVLARLHPEGDRMVITWWTPDDGLRETEVR
jgi:hypothetical protein